VVHLEQEVTLAADDGMLLQTNKLTKDYGRFRALDQLDLAIPGGEIFGLLGPNGSGKTTALRLLLGFLRPTSGSAAIAGHDCWKDSVAARRHVAYLPGELRLYENMTGRQLVAFLGRLRGQPQSGDVNALARRFEIDLERPIAHLSSGMKRKVALLQVLVPHVPLLILDEPTNALDPTMRGELLHQLRRARDEGQTVLFSSHVLGEVEQVCDRVGILQRGRLVHLQKMSELRQSRLVRASFAGPALPVPPDDRFRVREQVNGRVVLEHSGPLPDLLDWLGRQTLTDLSVEPLGLAPVYHRYHGAEA
jgi:ABC-2 type transport system ATP-binding protein